MPTSGHRHIRTFLGAAIALTVIACAPRVETRGNLPDSELIAEISPGKVSKDEVVEILGAPSTVAMFDTEVWYYISERTETTAFFKPELTDRQVLVIRFDDKGIVSTVQTIGKEAGKEVDPVERETPSAGHEMGFIEQVFGNFGRFNREK
ncbi:MAG: outer membrane protein assembly factor BamE [Rhodospirillales bacterium]|nr:outer membrane protein assembly factor BamE [Rhodospirillales bacterium]MCW8862916.1 outer membrane protein assembly factor BamE [Rhodospirillales bacterium]MCW8951596.1 outer membrane protein assembly factor BamE [Rhodospirillales bacterium]MCW8969679.1 outer membrane protein assembly factor BamE [Rhodospirillales bacterium]MCW9003468.1 outer membrane protein assembly factor BamE [Rhodospirillales bacterium]